MVAWMSNLKKLAPPPYTNAQPSTYTPGDFGKPGSWANDGPALTVKVRQLTGQEKQVAGLDVTKRLYRMWTDAEVYFTEGQVIRTDTDGDITVISIVEYPERGITVLEGERYSNA